MRIELLEPTTTDLEGLVVGSGGVLDPPADGAVQIGYGVVDRWVCERDEARPAGSCGRSETT